MIEAKDSGGDFTPAPEGLHSAVCCDVVDLGMVDSQWGKKHKVAIYWQIEEAQEDGRRFLVIARFSLTLHEKSRLRPTLEAWRGKRLTAAELKSFDLETLLGKGCQLSVLHAQTDRGTFANVSAITPLAKGQKPLAVEGYTRKVDRDDATTEQDREVAF